MPSIRKSEFIIEDFTQEINKIPRPWSLVDSMDLFTVNNVSTDTITVDVVQEKTDTFGDQRRGSDRTKVGPETVIAKPLVIPFFPLDGAVTPSDLQNLRKAGTANDAETLSSAQLKIMERIRRYHGALKEKALVEAILGTTYAPNGTIGAQSYFSVFETSQVTVDFAFSSGATDVLAVAESAWGSIIDNAQDGGQAYEIVALCSPGWFASFIAHPKVAGAYEAYASNPNPNRVRVGGKSIFRQFEHGNVLYIEYRGAFNGVPLIPANEAYFIPMGIADMFNIYYGPSDTLAAVNQPGVELYMQTVESPNGRRLDVESETALLAVNSRPELVIKATKS